MSKQRNHDPLDPPHLRVAACPLHESDVQRAREATDLDEETWARLDAALNCPDCQLVLAIMTGDDSFLPDGHTDRQYSVRIPKDYGNIQDDSQLATGAFDDESTNWHYRALADHPAAIHGIPDFDDTIVRNVRVWPHQEFLYSTRKGPIGIVPKDYSQLELIGMFDPSNPEQPSARSSCLTVMWRFRPGVNIFETSLPIDEMDLFLLKGELEWHFEGSTPIRLGAGPNRSQILWASADPSCETAGLPPFRVKAFGDNSALAIAKFYGWNGIPYSMERNGLIRLSGTAWEREQVEAYWRSIDLHVHQMANRKPFTASIPVNRDDFRSFMKSHQCRQRRDPHQNARSAGQLIDADILGWPTQNNHPMAFRKPERLVGDGRRKHPMLDFRLLTLPGEHSRTPAGMIQAAHHRGFETIIPLAGSIRCGWVELTPSQSDDPPAPLREFGAPREIRIDSTEVSKHERPQVLLLCSEIAHGFTAGGIEDGCALLIRSYDLYHERPQGRLRNNWQSLSRVG